MAVSLAMHADKRYIHISGTGDIEAAHAGEAMCNISGSSSTKAALLLVVVSVFTVFVLQNTEVVDITFFFWRVSVSRVLLLLGSGLVGGMAGFFLGWSVFGGEHRTKPVSGGSDRPEDY